MSYFYTSDDGFGPRHKPVTFAGPLCDSTDLGETAEVPSELPKASSQETDLAHGHTSPMFVTPAGAICDTYEGPFVTLTSQPFPPPPSSSLTLSEPSSALSLSLEAASSANSEARPKDL